MPTDNISRPFRGEPLDLVGGGGWSQALSMYFFFSGEFAVHDLFLDIRRLQDFFFEHNFRTILCI